MESIAVATTVQITPQIQTGTSAQSSTRVKFEATDLPNDCGPSRVYAPQHVQTPEQTVTVYLATGGLGGGHSSPMDAVAGQLLKLPDVKVIYDMNLPVVIFDRNAADHAKYKASDWKFGGKLANLYRSHYGARAEHRSIEDRVEHLIADPETAPNYVISNHRFIGSAMSAALPDGIGFATSVVDHRKLHGGWFNRRVTSKRPRLDRLFATNSFGAQHARSYGVPRERIQTLGYPVREPFERYADINKTEVRAKLKIPADKTVVMMTAGNARNVGNFGEQVAGLLQHEKASNLYLFALIGENQRLAGQLKALDSKGADIKVIAGVQDAEQMAEMMRAADYMAIQPGGGSIGECYAMSVVPILWTEKSGVEHSNRRHVAEARTGIVAFTKSRLMLPAARKAEDAARFRRAVFETTLADRDEMIRNQRQFKVLGAAQAIAKSVVALAREQANFSPRPGDEEAKTVGLPSELTLAMAQNVGSPETPMSPMSPVLSTSPPNLPTISQSQLPERKPVNF